MTNMMASLHNIDLLIEGKCIETYEFEFYDIFSIFHVYEPFLTWSFYMVGSTSASS